MTENLEVGQITGVGEKTGSFLTKPDFSLEEEQKKLLTSFSPYLNLILEGKLPENLEKIENQPLRITLKLGKKRLKQEEDFVLGGQESAFKALKEINPGFPVERPAVEVIKDLSGVRAIKFEKVEDLVDVLGIRAGEGEEAREAAIKVIQNQGGFGFLTHSGYVLVWGKGEILAQVKAHEQWEQVAQTGIDFLDRALGLAEREPLTAEEKYSQKLLADLGARIATATDNYSPAADRRLAQAYGVKPGLNLADLGPVNLRYQNSNQLLKSAIAYYRDKLDKELANKDLPEQEQVRKKIGLEILLHLVNVKELLFKNQISLGSVNLITTDFFPNLSVLKTAAEGRRLQPAFQFKPGDKVKVGAEKTTIVKTIGIGGQSEVYLVENDKGEKMALKGSLSTSGAVDSLIREINLTQNRLAGVKSITHVLDYRYANGRLWALIDYIDGITLETEISSFKYQSKVDGWKKLMLESLLALNEIHQAQDHRGKGAVHLDIKPGNIMRRSTDGKIIYIDPGTAVKLDRQGHSTSNLGIGTEGYCPPEQWDDKAVLTRATDIHAWAATMLEALTGKSPDEFQQLHSRLGFNDLNLVKLVLKSKIPNSSEREKLIDWFCKALEPDQQKRWQNIEEMIGSCPDLKLAGQFFIQDRWRQTEWKKVLKDFRKTFITAGLGGLVVYLMLLRNGNLDTSLEEIISQSSPTLALTDNSEVSQEPLLTATSIPTPIEEPTMIPIPADEPTPTKEPPAPTKEIVRDFSETSLFPKELPIYDFDRQVFNFQEVFTAAVLNEIPGKDRILSDPPWKYYQMPAGQYNFGGLYLNTDRFGESTESIYLGSADNVFLLPEPSGSSKGIVNFLLRGIEDKDFAQKIIVSTDSDWLAGNYSELQTKLEEQDVNPNRGISVTVNPDSSVLVFRSLNDCRLYDGYSKEEEKALYEFQGGREIYIWGIVRDRVNSQIYYYVSDNPLSAVSESGRIISGFIGGLEELRIPEDSKVNSQIWFLNVDPDLMSKAVADANLIALTAIAEAHSPTEAPTLTPSPEPNPTLVLGIENVNIKGETAGCEDEAIKGGRFPVEYLDYFKPGFSYQPTLYKNIPEQTQDGIIIVPSVWEKTVPEVWGVVLENGFWGTRTDPLYFINVKDDSFFKGEKYFIKGQGISLREDGRAFWWVIVPDEQDHIPAQEILKMPEPNTGGLLNLTATLVSTNEYQIVDCYSGPNRSQYRRAWADSDKAFVVAAVNDLHVEDGEGINVWLMVWNDTVKEYGFVRSDNLKFNPNQIGKIPFVQINTQNQDSWISIK
ncbi:hypothetical protein COT75_04200 [Candidatus Beckwithbacteria bacterium CG10_big_fil_rev_8_21_14_0_10_34_10]|uniref:Protein kinase domain-containing protein n=1 Tax=Candidatus Beckwithbacteria bacterium CG10_big_fil_rev_8_21_14_0_10_34_10 TaxID=1974495 RepID=A0A2H0W8C6_9BACT|nr:MAG: hypothetical protein COT75_04200 [Candidatus Beckwithbacteria bacterium CG10_big_fil_rev_8_21_14_0_10_34_10]